MLLWRIFLNNIFFNFSCRLTLSPRKQNYSSRLETVEYFENGYVRWRNVLQIVRFRSGSFLRRKWSIYVDRGNGGILGTLLCYIRFLNNFWFFRIRIFIVVLFWAAPMALSRLPVIYGQSVQRCIKRRLRCCHFDRTVEGKIEKSCKSFYWFLILYSFYFSGIKWWRKKKAASFPDIKNSKTDLFITKGIFRRIACCRGKLVPFILIFFFIDFSF